MSLTNVVGKVGYDIVAVNGTNIWANSTLLMALQVSPQNNDSFYGAPNVNGMLGLSYISSPNFLDVAHYTNQISTGAFSLDLNDQSQTSYFYYNNGLPSSVTENMVWAAQKPNFSGYWMTALTSVKVNGLNLTTSAAKSIVLDTGTPFITFNANFYESVVQEFFSTRECFKDTNNNDFTTCYCNRTWPTFTFNFSSNASVTLTPSLYKYKSTSKAGYCYAGILPSVSVNTYIVLGAVFFRGYIITFDRVNNRIGFYNKLQVNNPVKISYFNPGSFIASQYSLGVVQFIFAAVGVVMFLKSKRIFKGKSYQQQLGMRMM